jgi:hypothetical protein
MISVSRPVTPIALQAVAYIALLELGISPDDAMLALPDGVRAKALDRMAETRFRVNAISHLLSGWLPRGGIKLTLVA